MVEVEDAKDVDRVPPEMELSGLIGGMRVTQMIYVAAKLGIADHLQDGPKSSAQLAELVGADPRMLYRLLRSLASLGIFAEREEKVFGLTALAEPLRTGGPMRAWALMLGEGWYWEPWGDLLHNVRTGETAFAHVFGVGMFEYLTAHPEEGQIFNDAMTSGTRGITEAFLSAYDFSNFKKVVDVGGGHGILVAKLLRTHPHLRAVIFDRPEVVEGARSLLEAEGVMERGQLVGGDFFEAVPEGGDVYVLKHIIHDWDDDRAIAILRNCRRAMGSQGRVLLLEYVLPAGSEPHPGQIADITMMVMVGGRERTENEFRDLFEQAGLRLTRIIPTESPVSVLEGVPS
ncbi:MAG: acetylserotonin O-methyltransferase [Candidatus Thermoplasmatota archaeon]|nr:acetylserotonin O-methyltransferase [Candidatus Thermoplasmatota archaeon]